MSAKKSSPKNPPTVVDVDRDQLIFCDHRSGTTFAFPYPPGSMKDLEVVNREELGAKLKNFITDRKLVPTDLVFVLSPNVCFEKDLPHLSEDERQNHTTQFLDMVPFSSISSKLFHVGNDYKLAAINRDFYESLAKPFTALGFSVVAVVPSFILGTMGVKGNFDIEACRVISKRLDYVLENSFLTPAPPTEGLGGHRQYIKDHPLVFVALSVALVTLLGVTSFLTLRRPPRRVVAAPPPKISVAPTQVPSPTPEATPSAQLTVQVLNGSGRPGQATEIHAALEKLGFTSSNITTGNAIGSPSQTLVVYSARVPNPLRDRVGDLLKNFSPTFSTAEVASPSSDIIITTAPTKP